MPEQSKDGDAKHLTKTAKIKKPKLLNDNMYLV
jgi:hypothetical protein